MTLPGMPGSQVSNDGDIMRIIADLQRQVKELAAQNVLATAGMTTQPNGVTFGGSVLINGNLSVPNGSITNDALTNPTVMATSGLTQNNYATTVGGNTFAQATVAVPAGYTQASIVCMVVAGARNSTAAIDFIYASSSINGVAGGETPQSAVANGGYASAAANGIRTLTGLSGGNITLGCNVRTGAAWAANTANFANMNAFIYFQR